MKPKVPDTTTTLLILHEREDRKLKTFGCPKEQQLLVNLIEAAANMSGGRDEVEATLRDCKPRRNRR